MMNKCDLPSTLVQALQRRAMDEPDNVALRFLAEEGNDSEPMTYGELDYRARLIAAALQVETAPGDRAVLLFPSGLDYVAAFFGCLYAGVIAVPAYPPESTRRQHQERLLSIIADAQPRLLLTNVVLSEPLLQMSQQLSSADTSVALPKLLCVDALDDGDVRAWQGPVLQPSDIAFLQYTSGSTSAPKGVQVTHHNLIVNEELIRLGFGIGDEDVIVSWLPLYHDMGLIGCLLQSIYSGILCVLMSPHYFLERPVRWLEAMSEHGGTISGGPDFAYRLCSERIPESALSTLDLSRWQVAFSGSEPIRQDSLDLFGRQFADCGFDKNHFFSCYGLAEATLFVTGGIRKQGITALQLDGKTLAQNRAKVGNDSTVMSCGSSQPGHAIRIVDPKDSGGLIDCRVGEIWTTGPSIAQGYWRNQEASAETFVEYDGRTWLRTGDLGFVREGELFVTGRLKDMLIVRGQNLYPQDIERIVEEEVEIVRKGRVAAFAINHNGKESIGIAAEVGRKLQKLVPPEALINRIREVVAEVCQEAPQQVALLNPGSLPKTSSGKLQRSACRQRLADDSIDAYATYPEKKEAEKKETTQKKTVKNPESVSVTNNLSAESANLTADIIAIWCSALSCRQVAMEDNFFLLGGNSVLAMQVVAQCTEHVGMAVDLRLLFENPVLSEFVAAIENKRITSSLEEGGVKKENTIPLQSREQGLPLSSAQSRLWFLWQLDTQSIAYNIPAGLHLRGDIDKAALSASFQCLLQRHESLRTRFAEHGGTVLQYSKPVAEFEIPHVDISLLPAAKRKIQAELLQEQEAHIRFDLEAGSLLRVKLIQLDKDEHLLLITLHHIIADGWSLNVLMTEFAELYAASSQDNDTALVLNPLPLQYADYASWQRQWLEGKEAGRQVDYWKKQLTGEQSILHLATDYPRIQPSDNEDAPSTIQPKNKAARFSLSLDHGLTDTLRSIAQAQDATLFMLLLAAFQSLLHRYTGQNDIRVGVPSANRQRADIQHLVGFFINTLVLRADVNPRQPFTQLLAQVRQTTLDAQRHQDIPIDKVVETIVSGNQLESMARNHDESPLFQVMFNHQQRGLSAFHRLPELSVEELPWHSREAKCDLQLHSEEDEQGRLKLSFDYASALFEQKTIQCLAEHFISLLQHIAKQPEHCVGDIPLLPMAEQKKLTRWSEAAVKTANPESLELLAESLNKQALLTPQAVALQWDGGSLDYGQLNTKANRLAHYLQDQGVGPDVCVAILADRSPELLIALLAIIKAGGAYVPLDPEYPAERLAYMLADSGAELLLTESAWFKTDLFDQLTLVQSLNFIAMDKLKLDHWPSSAPDLQLQGDNLAYVIYTSGSTGLPKGVGITHIALRERLQWMKAAYQFTAQDVFLQKAPISFDVSVWECFLPLITGSRLVLAAPGEQRDPQRLVALVQQYGVTVLHFVPPLLQLFIEEPTVNACASLRYLFSGGEALSVALRNRVFSQLPAVELHNRYGPTETAINVTHWYCQEVDAHRSPIGKPLANVICRVLDGELQAAPIGVPGELYIGGTGLARGYLGRAALTAERFVPDPFSTQRGRKRGARLYRTGDQSRWSADGSLDYRGRVDQQIKLRGFRIEPQEIEAQLLAQAMIKHAAVVVHGSNTNAQLIAYYVIDELELNSNKNGQGTTPDDELLKTPLQNTLPNYMIPTQFVALDELPLTVNGKVDYRALPEPNDSAGELVEYIEPATPLEQQIAAIWQEVLGISRIGLRDDFFQRGGHSLLATQIVSRTRLQCDVELPLKVLFESSELGAFVEQVAHAQQAGRLNRMPPIELIDRSQPVPLSSSQQRLWFLWQLEPDSPAYNVGGMARMRGLLHAEYFDAALQALIQRHETLRTTFPNVDGVPVQQVADTSTVLLRRKDFSSLGGDECQQRLQQLADDEAHQPFDLEQGPLLRACLVKVSEKEHVLALTLHHIVTEGWAMDIFARELGELYEAFVDNKTSPLAPLPVQYLDYSVWQRQWLESGEGQRQLDYWTAQLGNEHPLLALPSDRPRPPVQSYEGGLYRFAVSDALAEKVRAFNTEQGLTLFMTMTAALAVLLYRYSGQNDLRIGAPVANRIRPESEGLIGAFLNTQVLRCQLDGQMTVATLLTQLRDTVIEGQSHQDLPFDQLVDALKPPRSTAYNPLFQVMCNVQRWNFQQSRELAGMTVDYIVNDAKATKFDLNLEVTDLNDQLNCCLTYSRDLFDEVRIAHMARHWNNLLTAMVNNPSQRIAELSLFSKKESLDEEQSVFLSRLNSSTNQHQPLQYCLHELFTQQVTATPNAPALTFDGQTLTYAELNSRANRLAWVLREQGVGPEVYVGLALERSFEMVIGLLAILKAGGAYVPLDPEYPIDRLRVMIDDSGIDLLLSHSELFDALGELPTGVKPWCFEEHATALADYPDSELPAISLPQHQAYLIYTSGSTGKPKGVMVSHGEISMHCQAVIERFGMRSDDCELHFYSINFDAATERLLAPLLCGAHVVLRGQGQWGAEEICQLIREHNVTTLGFTPSYGSQLAQWLSSRQECLPVRLCITGGEALTAEHLHRIRTAFQPEQFFNAYGPTETVVMPLASLAPEQLDEQLASVPIGRLLGAREAYILDDDLALLPQGSIGELYIGSESLARGYHQRSGLTAERFVPDPFISIAPYTSVAKAGRLYRTGDLVRQGVDGLVEYMGRADYQVKIRGFRIELGEIEARLLEHPDVDEAVVLALELGGSKQLVGYVSSKVVSGPIVSSKDEGESLIAGKSLEDAEDKNNKQYEPLKNQLKDNLKAQLPDYMVPTQLVVLPSLPLSPNGKLDRKALPVPDIEQNQQVYIAPRNEQEQSLAAIWCDVLAVEKIGVNDNFFELGGDSILSIQVVSRARQIGLHFSPRDLFQHQTVAALASVATQQQDGVQQCVAEQGLVSGESALTPIQHWFFDMPMSNRHHWNQAVLLEPTEPLDAHRLEQVLQQLLQQHDALRLVFSSHHSKGKGQREKIAWQAQHRRLQAQNDTLLQTVAVSDIEQCEEQCQQLFEEIQRSLNITQGPLLRAVLINENATNGTVVNGLKKKQRLFLVIHHLVVDGVSWRIILEDLQHLYRQLIAGKTPQLPLKTSAFRDWSARLQTYASNESLRETLAWWQAQLAPLGLEHVDTEPLPRDYPDGDETFNKALEQDQEYHAKTISLRLNSKRTQQLLQQAPVAYRTQVNDLLLTALTRVLCRWTKKPSVLVQLEGHGREELFADIDLTRTVGWFTSAYPLRLTPSLSVDELQDESDEGQTETQALTQAIKAIKEQLRAVPHKGLSYGVLRYLADETNRTAMAELPEAQITFNYLGQFDQSFGHDTLFRPLSDSTGASRDEQAVLPNALSVDSQVYSNELIVRWTYSSKRYDAQTITTLASDYLSELENIIEHCVNDALLDNNTSRLTPSDFPLAQLTQTQLDALVVPAHTIEDIYPLTPMQEGLLLHTLLEPGTGIYYMQDRYRIHSAIDPQRFVKAWQTVVARHETLRASFSWNTGESMLQVIHKPGLIDVDFLDWSQEDSSQHEQRLQALLKTEREAGFDLLNTPPFHLRLICLSETEYWFMMSNHHILIDAWCRSLLMNDFFEIYTALSESREANLPTPPRYRDYIAWLQQQNTEASQQWWQGNLQGFEQATPIASDRPLLREHAGDSGGMVVGDCYTQLATDDSTRLQALAQRHQLTINTFAQAAWALVLRRLSGDRDVLFGVTVAGRPIDVPAMQRTVGLFINSVPLRVPMPSVSESCTVQEWLQQLLAHNLELREHEYLSLVDIQDCSELPKGEPLFDSLFVFENAPVETSVLDSARHFNASSDSGRTHTNFPLTAVCYPGDNLGLHLSYDQRYFDEKTVEGILSEFKRLLLVLAERLHEPLQALPLLSNDERDFLVQACNPGTHHDETSSDSFPSESNQSYVQLFEAQVEAHPQRIVASCLEQQWSYDDLNQYANGLGYALLARGVAADQPVALLAERGLNLLGMIIGCFKSGAAYLPLDPSHPEQRLVHMITASNAPLLVCDHSSFEYAQALLEQFPCSNRPELVLWEDLQQGDSDSLPVDANNKITNPGVENPHTYGRANSLAYVIYTSGSTGVPKGVMVEQQGMLNNQLSKIPYLQLSKNDVIAQTASQCFDISVWQFLTAPLFGGRVDIVPNEVAHNPQALLAHIQTHGISVLESVPSLIQSLLDEEKNTATEEKPLGGEYQLQQCLRWLLPTGEAMPPALAQQWLNTYPDIGLVNAYGPAECSDDVAFFRIDQAATASHYVPIGSPTDNNRLYLLDDDLALVPIGAIAELCVAGIGVGRGYSHDPQRTAQAFVPDPFSEKGERLYRSGDLARRRSDGLLEYVGRMDQQVKIRGFRIELGEIEAQLHKQSQISEAAVTVQKGSNGAYLVAYIVAADPVPSGLPSVEGEGSSQPAADLIVQLKESLGRELPDYMLPLHWQLLESMPRNANGKLDRKSLPYFDVGQQHSEAYVAPRNALEQTLVEIWAELLKVERVGIRDNFFELGGHSLIATQIASRLQKVLQRNVPLRAMFECGTVEELANHIDSLESTVISEEKTERLNDLMAQLEEL